MQPLCGFLASFQREHGVACPHAGAQAQNHSGAIRAGKPGQHTAPYPAAGPPHLAQQRRADAPAAEPGGDPKLGEPPQAPPRHRSSKSHHLILVAGHPECALGGQQQVRIEGWRQIRPVRRGLPASRLLLRVGAGQIDRPRAWQIFGLGRFQRCGGCRHGAGLYFRSSSRSGAWNQSPPLGVSARGQKLPMGLG